MPPRRASSACLLLAALVPAASCGRSEAASVQIVQPADGELAIGVDVLVILEARGVEIAPASEVREGTAHHHLFVDRDPTPLSDTIPAGVTGILHLGRGQTEFLLEGLETGPHVVIALLADRDHIPLDPPAADTVRFTVEP